MVLLNLTFEADSKLVVYRSSFLSTNIDVIVFDSKPSFKSTRFIMLSLVSKINIPPSKEISGK